jgi:hypothetical protein
LVGLQKELQHSLTSNRTKREEIQQLRAQFEEVQKHLVAKENEIERLEMLVRKQEVNTCHNIIIIGCLGVPSRHAAIFALYSVDNCRLFRPQYFLLTREMSKERFLAFITWILIPPSAPHSLLTSSKNLLL